VAVDGGVFGFDARSEPCRGRLGGGVRDQGFDHAQNFVGGNGTIGVDKAEEAGLGFEGDQMLPAGEDRSALAAVARQRHEREQEGVLLAHVVDIGLQFLAFRGAGPVIDSKQPDARIGVFCNQCAERIEKGRESLGFLETRNDDSDGRWIWGI